MLTCFNERISGFYLLPMATRVTSFIFDCDVLAGRAIFGHPAFSYVKLVTEFVMIFTLGYISTPGVVLY